MFDGLEEMSLLSDEQVNALFGDTEDSNDNKSNGDSQDAPKNNDPENDLSTKQNPAEEKSADINPENLFEDSEDDDDDPESVGGEEKQGKKDGAPSSKSVPPFSSLAKALKEEGVLLDLEDSDIEKVSTGEDFVELIERTIQAKFDERQKRVDEALTNGVEPSLIHKYENMLQQLNSITDAQLADESEQGELFRKNLLYRDYLNKNFSEERAKRAVERAFADGTDIEDAKEALSSIKETIQAQYDTTLKEAKAEEEAVKKHQEEQANALRKGLLEDKEIFGDLEVDKAVRRKALDAIIKPVYQDPKTGEQFTAIQMYEKENRVDFLKKVGLIYAMTDGFKSLDGLIGKKVKKEVSKGMRELEDSLNNTHRKTDGSLDFVSSARDTESFLGFTLDL